MKSSLPIKVFASVLALGVLAGCATNPAERLPNLNSPRLTDYRLGPGDRLKLVIFGQETLPADYVVDDQGMVSVPLAGAVPAAGLKPRELEQRVAKALDKMVVDPHVSVQVFDARPIYITGGVNRPGAYAYVKDMTVLNAIALGGGFATGAYEDPIGVTREVNGKKAEFKASRDDFIYPGDVVYVYKMY